MFRTGLQEGGFPFFHTDITTQESGANQPSVLHHTVFPLSGLHPAAFPQLYSTLCVIFVMHIHCASVRVVHVQLLIPFRLLMPCSFNLPQTLLTTSVCGFNWHLGTQVSKRDHLPYYTAELINTRVIIYLNVVVISISVHKQTLVVSCWLWSCD